MRRSLLLLAVMLGIGLAAPLSAQAAEPSLSISGLRQEAGLVEFYLSAQDLPAGADLSKVTVAVNDLNLAVQTTPLEQSAGTEAPHRVVVLVLDTSGSMQGAPLTAARAAARAYVDQLPADVEIGLVTAGATAKILLKPTRDRAATRRTLDALTAEGETALYDGLQAAAGQISAGDWPQRRIVLLSDGADTASTVKLETVRKAAVDGKIPVDTIAFRTVDATVDVLASLAAATNGTAYTAGNATALSRAFSEAAGSFTVQLLVRATVPAALSGAQTRLTVAAGGASTTLDLRLAVDTKAAAPLTGVEAPRPGGAFLLTLTGSVFVAILAAGVLVVSPVFSASARRRRLAQVEQFTAAPPRRSASSLQDQTGQVTQAALAFSAQIVKSANAEGRIAAQLDRAGMRLRPHEWLLVRALVCLTASVLLALSANLVVGILLGPIIGVALTSLYRRNRAAKRVQAFSDLLPDALQLVIGSLRSGFSLSQALDAVARELPDPISTEFGRVLGEHRLGVELEDALERLAERMRSRDLGWAVVAVRVQREVGGNLAEVLATTVETIRERDSLRRHVRSLTAEGRLSAWVLLVLPIGVGTFMFLFRGEYIAPLYTHPIGILMSVTGVALLCIGAFWLSRLVKVEV